MKKTNIFRSIALALAASFILTSCTPLSTAGQKNWIKELGKAFPDDTFTYEGHPERSIGGTDYSTVLVSSELYPGAVISIWKEKGEVRTNYHTLAYEEECYEELDRILNGRFPCSSYLITGHNQYNEGGYPLEDFGAKKFIKEYMDYECDMFLFYEDESQIPTEEEMEELLIDLASYESHIYSIHFKYIDIKYADDEKLARKNYTVDYLLHMKTEDRIDNIYVSYKDPAIDNHYIVEDLDI